MRQQCPLCLAFVARRVTLTLAWSPEEKGSESKEWTVCESCVSTCSLCRTVFLNRQRLLAHVERADTGTPAACQTACPSDQFCLSCLADWVPCTRCAPSHLRSLCACTDGTPCRACRLSFLDRAPIRVLDDYVRHRAQWTPTVLQGETLEHWCASCLRQTTCTIPHCTQLISNWHPRTFAAGKPCDSCQGVTVSKCPECQTHVATTLPDTTIAAPVAVSCRWKDWTVASVTTPVPFRVVERLWLASDQMVTGVGCGNCVEPCYVCGRLCKGNAGTGGRFRSYPCGYCHRTYCATCAELFRPSTVRVGSVGAQAQDQRRQIRCFFCATHGLHTYDLRVWRAFFTLTSFSSVLPDAEWDKIMARAGVVHNMERQPRPLLHKRRRQEEDEEPVILAKTAGLAIPRLGRDPKEEQVVPTDRYHASRWNKDASAWDLHASAMRKQVNEKRQRLQQERSLFLSAANLEDDDDTFVESPSESGL